jgi:hypothetical protein
MGRPPRAHATIDYVLPAAEIAPLLVRLARGPMQGEPEGDRLAEPASGSNVEPSWRKRTRWVRRKIARHPFASVRTNVA